MLGDPLIEGVWFAAIGWFLAQTARASYEQFELRGLLVGAEAHEVMEGTFRSIPVESNLRRARDAMLPFEGRFVVRPHAHTGEVVDRLHEAGIGFVVVISDGRLVGLVTAADQGRWVRRRQLAA